MARPLRLQVAGGIYHVTARGDAGDDIYLDDVDRRCFLRVLGSVRSRFAWQFLAYCLMGNHYHLVVETPRPNLSRGMRHLNGTYAQRFNQRHRRTQEHLFQGRFYGALVQRDSHLLELFRYVARNPVREGLCEIPESWRWSSHCAVLGLEPPGVVAVEAALSYFGGAPDDARRYYRAFVDRLEPNELIPTRGPVVGSEAFMRSLLPQQRPSAEIPRAPWNAVRPPLPEILATFEPNEAMARAYREFDYSMREIGEAAGCHYSTVSRRIRAWEAADVAMQDLTLFR